LAIRCTQIAENKTAAIHPTENKSTSATIVTASTYNQIRHKPALNYRAKS
jgi:hypothetical protein